MDAEKGSVEEKKLAKLSVLFDSFLPFTPLPTGRLKSRKQSYGFSTVAGIKHAERTAPVGLEYRRPILTYQNTYQLEPRERFDCVQVTTAINSLLDRLFTEQHKYNPQASSELALRISAKLLKTIKLMRFNRYRILSVVTIGQKRAQSYVNAVAFLWDAGRDNFVNVQREEHSCLIQVTIFGIYLD